MTNANPFMMAHDLAEQIKQAIDKVEHLSDIESPDGIYFSIRRALLALRDAELHAEFCI
jgi:hypothetical protein